MSRLKVAAVTAVLAVAGGAFAGCGDDDEKNDYVDQVNELQTAYVDDVGQIASGAPPTSAAELGDYATELADLTAGLATDIEAVDPPEEVADLHTELVDELNGVADQISDAEGEITGAPPEQALEAATDLQQATVDAQTELQNIINEINSTLQD
jgi:hypothetical protein